ncbi:hypothetical protein ACS127_08815 [Amphibacillus sp. Q70]|uniref:hypothetical protein n=1 Tax=Amphibacillus sp. Q70 TaxID=3453416 RepID=UPI003F879C85
MASGVSTLLKDKVRRANTVNVATLILFEITERLLFGVNLRAIYILGSGAVAYSGNNCYLLNSY